MEFKVFKNPLKTLVKLRCMGALGVDTKTRPPSTTYTSYAKTVFQHFGRNLQVSIPIIASIMLSQVVHFDYVNLSETFGIGVSHSKLMLIKRALISRHGCRLGPLKCYDTPWEIRESNTSSVLLSCHVT